MKEFAGKVAMITGAAHGIGYSFALEAVRRGMKLALVDIDAPALEAVAAECREMGAEVLTCETDVCLRGGQGFRTGHHGPVWTD